MASPDPDPRHGGAKPLRLVLLGGPPAVGKTTVARTFLRRCAGGPFLVQWIDVDALWQHQPWRVDDVTVAMLHANLRAVLHNASEAGVDVVVVSWVFQTPWFHELVVSLAPPATTALRVRLGASAAVWEERLATRMIESEHRAFYQDRYDQASACPADHVIETDHQPVTGTADALAEVVAAWLDGTPADLPGET